MSLAQHIFKDKFIFQNPSFNSSIVFGFCSGVLGAIMMINSVKILNVRQFKKSFNSLSQLTIRKGEEFSILLLDCLASKAVKIAERLRNNVEKNDFYILDNKTINITISIGISSYPELTGEIDNLYKNADTALYEAKHGGRNEVVLFNNIPEEIYEKDL